MPAITESSHEVVRHGKDYRKVRKLGDVSKITANKNRTAKIEETKKNEKFCPGLCPPSRIWPRTQSEFVRALVDRQIRNLPINTFLVESSTQKLRFNNISLPKPSPTVNISKLNFSRVWKNLSQLAKPRNILPWNLSEYTLKEIVTAVSEAKILSATPTKKGTQLKAAVLLQGKQWVLFKPQRYPRNATMPTDTPYSGADRHNAEIAAFYLSRILGLNRVPVAVGRKIGLKNELLEVANSALAKTFLSKSGKLCFYGVCLYCNAAEAVCEDNKGFLEGAVIIMLPPPYDKLSRIRSPWARTYDNTKSAPWETQTDYCNSVQRHELFGKNPIFLDLMDMAVFDWLIGNADRHRLETFDDTKTDGILLLDNGKSFGNAKIDEITILAPLYQCCKIRKRTYHELNRLSELNVGAMLDQNMREDPVYPILTPDHLEAVNRRLRKLVMVLAACIEHHGENNVLQDDGY